MFKCSVNLAIRIEPLTCRETGFESGLKRGMAEFLGYNVHEKEEQLSQKCISMMIPNLGNEEGI